MFPDTSRTGSPKVCRALAKSSPMVTTFGPTSIGRTQRMSSPWTEILGQVTLCRTLGKGMPFKNIQDRFPNMLNCQKDGFRIGSGGRAIGAHSASPSQTFHSCHWALLSSLAMLIQHQLMIDITIFVGAKSSYASWWPFWGYLKELQSFYKESPRS